MTPQAKDRRTKAELVAEYEARIGKLLEKQSSLLEELREADQAKINLGGLANALQKNVDSCRTELSNACDRMDELEMRRDRENQTAENAIRYWEKQARLNGDVARASETWMEANDAKAERLSRCAHKLQSMTFRRNAWRGLAIGLGVLPVLMTLREMGVLP